MKTNAMAFMGHNQKEPALSNGLSLELEVVSGETHVLWLDEAGKPSVLWVFQGNVPAPSGRWTDAESGLEAGGILGKNRVFFSD